jgi:hypothetical protein
MLCRHVVYPMLGVVEKNGHKSRCGLLDKDADLPCLGLCLQGLVVDVVPGSESGRYAGSSDCQPRRYGSPNLHIEHKGSIGQNSG